MSLSFVSRAARAVSELTSTTLDLLLPRSLSRRILAQVDPYAPHAGTGFEGWYSRIVCDDFSIAIIMCSLAPSSDAPFEKQHYLHFSLIPLRPNSESSSIKERINLHLFPSQIVPTALSPGSLPFTLDAPGFGTYTVHEDQQVYELRLPDEENRVLYTVRVPLSGRQPLDDADSRASPEGSFVRLESTLPLHWAIFSTASDASVSIRKRPLGEARDEEGEDELIAKTSGRAHIEKNWGVSFPQGWTWSQVSRAGDSPVTLTLAGGMILRNKAFMVHYRSPKRVWTLRPPFTIIFAIPRPWRLFERLWSKSAPADWRDMFWQWGPFTSERYDNAKGVLQVTTQDLFRRLSIDVRAKDAPSKDAWLALYCPLPGGHSTTAYETFTARLEVTAEVRTFPFGTWGKAERSVVDNAALEFGGDYWMDSPKVHLE